MHFIWQVTESIIQDIIKYFNNSNAKDVDGLDCNLKKDNSVIFLAPITHFVTTETVKCINEKSFIENLSALKYSMCAQRGKQM